MWQVLWNNSKEKVLMGGQENKLQMLQISQNQILCMTILPCVFAIPVKFEIYFLALPFSINGPGEIKLEQI